MLRPMWTTRRSRESVRSLDKPVDSAGVRGLFRVSSQMPRQAANWARFQGPTLGFRIQRQTRAQLEHARDARKISMDVVRQATLP